MDWEKKDVEISGRAQASRDIGQNLWIPAAAWGDGIPGVAHGRAGENGEKEESEVRGRNESDAKADEISDVDMTGKYAVVEEEKRELNGSRQHGVDVLADSEVLESSREPGYWHVPHMASNAPGQACNRS